MVVEVACLIDAGGRRRGEARCMACVLARLKTRSAVLLYSVRTKAQQFSNSGVTLIATVKQGINAARLFGSAFGCRFVCKSLACQGGSVAQSL